MKHLSEVQYKAEERQRKVTTRQHATTFQLPEATQATGEHEYILTIPETQTVSIPVVQPTQTSTGEPVTVIAKVQQPQRPSSSSPSTQPATSYIIVDDQQPGSSRQMIHNPTTVASSQQEESQHNTSGLSSIFWLFQLFYSISRSTPQPFHPLNLNQQHHQCHIPLIMNSQDLPASPARTVSGLARTAD